MSDGQCKARDARRKAKQRLKTPKEKCVLVVEEPMDQVQEPMNQYQEPAYNPLDHLDNEQKDLVEKLVAWQDQYEVPSDDDISKLAVNFYFIAPR